MMLRSSLIGLVLSAGAAIALSACSSEPQRRPTTLQSSAQLAPDKKISGAWLYRAPTANFAQYKRVMIDNVALYGGPEANFKEITPADQTRYATMIGVKLRSVIGEKYQIVTAPAPDVLRIHTTLIGVESTVGGVATVTSILPIGMAINAVRGASGEGGSLTGGIELAVEVLDSQSGALLAGAVRHVAPGAFDFGATVSTANTVDACAQEAATNLRDALDRNTRG